MATDWKKYPFSAYVEVRELKVYEVDARNVQDATAAVKSLLSSQDEILDCRSKRGKRFCYEVRAGHTVLRDGWR